MRRSRLMSWGRRRDVEPQVDVDERLSPFISEPEPEGAAELADPVSVTVLPPSARLELMMEFRGLGKVAAV